MIKIQNVSYRYPAAEAESLKHIDLDIPKGQFVILAGASGCGKTTLTRLVNGLIPHYFEGQLEGSYFFREKEIRQWELEHLAAFTGSVFQNPKSQFFTTDTTGEIVFGCENLGIGKDAVMDRLRRTVTELNLEPLVARNIFRLSGGEKQKIACASVYAMEPELIVLDEPSSNLDFAAVQTLRDILQKWKRQGKTVVIAEHRLYYVYDLADRMIYMEAGRIKADWNRSCIAAMAKEERMAYGLRNFRLNDIRDIRLRETEPPKDSIRLSDFTYAYEKKHVLHIEQCRLPAAGVIAVIGRNGAGKSTLLKSVCGLLNTGRLEIGGKTYAGKDRLKICYMVMQDVNHQLFTDTVEKEVMLSLPQKDAASAQRILKALDLEAYAHAHPLSLSGGQKQRVAIASALASERPIIAFDEPTGGLDLRHMREVARLIKNIGANNKLALLVTHDLELILEAASYVIVMAERRIACRYALTEKNKDKLFQYFENGGNGNAGTEET